MDKLIKQRGRIKGKLTRISTFAEQINLATIAASDINVRLEIMKEIWTEFDSVQIQIEGEHEGDELKKHQDEQVQFENKFVTTKSKLLKVLDSLSTGSTVLPATGSAFPNIVQTSSTVSQVKLPIMELPTFNGDYQQWSSFSDLFTAVIDKNANLTGVQKLHYLKSAVRGEAGRLLNSITTTEANYIEAWKILKERYSNKKQIINAHLKTLYAQPKLVSESVSDLRKLLDVTVENTRALHALNLPTDQWDCLLIFLVTERLDYNTHRQWEIATSDDDKPTFGHLKDFIEKRCRALEATKVAENRSSIAVKGATRQQSTKQPFAVQTYPTTKSVCVRCKANHPVYKCEQFLNLSVQQRIDLVKANALCFNCLRNGHSSRQCSSSLCRKCNKPHNTLLHYEQPPSVPVKSDSVASVATHFISDGTEFSQVLLSTAVVYIRNLLGQNQICRVLLDSGSQASFVTESCVHRLGLKRQKTHINLNGVGHCGAGVAKGMVCLRLSSVNSSFSCDVQALILPMVTGQLPSYPINPNKWTHCLGLKLADPTCYHPSTIDLLIGADILPELYLDGKIKGPENSPMALNTKLGWILTGPVGSNRTTISPYAHHISLNIDEQIKKFWELEEITPVQLLSREEKACEQHFEATHSRDVTGRYMVQLPFGNNVADLGNSRGIALNRLLQVERRMAHNPQRWQQYIDFMSEYQSMNHMEVVKTSELNASPVYYLPHHCVVKETSTTTKLRVVFDGSVRPSSGISLNESLLVGPSIQDDLVNIVLRFRMHKVALTADIAKMYRQILVHPDDCNFQRILWRSSTNDPIREYKLRTVTYGTASAPYLATRCLQQLSHDEQHNYPLGSRVLKQDFYIDDLISGAESVPEAIELQTQLIKFLNSGGFELRKWSSSSTTVVDSLPKNLRDNDSALQFAFDGSVKTLGLYWQPISDSFLFQVSVPSQSIVITKRIILSETAKLFDPLGWFAPVVIRAKLIIQKIWLLGLTWDEALPADVVRFWTQYRQELPAIEAVRIQRNICLFRGMVQLHGFCDASERAYGAVIFLRSVDTSNNVDVNLVCAKSRVAPLKNVSLPRLELCGALLLGRLLCKVVQALSVSEENVFAWTDSTIVLSWLRGHANQWKTFVANQISELQDLVSPNHWRHVDSVDNPADCLSRGLLPTQIINFSLWWKGPTWLVEEESKWPIKQNVLPQTYELLTEQRKIVTSCTATIQEFSLLGQYSSLNKLIRITAICIRFIKNCQLPQEKRSYGFLTTREFQYGLTIWIKQAQANTFGLEKECCINNEPLPLRSSLLSLNPFLDSNGILRVGGRLQEANINYDTKHPIILPRHHALTSLIINHEHINRLHAGPQLLLTSLRQRYWIISARQTVRHHIHKCVKCFRHRVTTAQQLMGNLPKSRLEPARAFLRCGIDYAGPLFIRLARGRGKFKMHKSYICIFICFVTRAIHLELVNDSTTDSFIASLRRFCSRRGKPSDIFSDCGTNFVGGNNKLKEFLKLVQSSTHKYQVSNLLTAEGINWHFNPPSTPHFGGLWEAGVRSVKFHLRRVVGNAILTYEEMYTILTQIEACLNSRPLCPLSSDPSDLSVLTPGHFLIGDAITSIPDPDLCHLPSNRLSRWQLVQQTFQHFWKRWSSEYLGRLQQRPKWVSAKRNISINDLVLLKDKDVSPFKWPLARVIEVHPGKDKLVRIVSVKTANGIFKRPVTKCCILPIDNLSQESQGAI